MQDLYNDEQKMNFIDSLPNYPNERIRKNYENLFRSISKYEVKLEKDFCDMNIPEVKMVVASIGFLSAASLYTNIAMLRDYNNWCVATGKTSSENTLLKLQNEDFDMSFSIRSKLLKSPEQLLEILKVAYDDEETAYQKQSKLIALLLYFGFSVEEIRHLTTADIERFKNNSSKYSDNGECVSMILELMQQCSELLEVKTKGGRNGGEKIDYLVDSEYILRSKANARADPSGMLNYSVILDRLRDINIQYAENTGTALALSVDRLSKSGIFYKLYQREQTGEKISVQLMQQIFGKQYQNNITVKNEASKKIKDFQNWKKAFEL